MMEGGCECAVSAVMLGLPVLVGRCLFNRPAQSEAWAGIPPLRVVNGSFADLGGGAKKNRSKLIGF